MSMKRFMNKKVAAIGLAAGLVHGGAGAAFAYFTANGNGTGQGTVGSASTWGVAQTTSTGTMLPGSGTSVIEFTVTNNSTGAQAIESGDLVGEDLVYSPQRHQRRRGQADRRIVRPQHRDLVHRANLPSLAGHSGPHPRLPTTQVACREWSKVIPGFRALASTDRIPSSGSRCLPAGPANAPL